MATSACVLVHGGWHGGWHWDDVARRLRGAGVRVFAPTLRGLAERAVEATESTCLADHVADVVGVLDDNDLRDVVLVGHSYGGAVVTGAAHQRPDRVAKLVYLDAFVPEHGQSLADLLGPQFAENARAQARAAGTYSLPPAFAMEDVLGVGPDEAAAHAARLSPHPLGTMLDSLDAPGELAAERTYICCTRNPLGMFDVYARRARESNDWRYYELPSPHDAVYAMPAVVAGIVEHLAKDKRAAGRGSDAASDERAMALSADRAFFAALLAGDATALDTQLADDFVIVDVAAGGVTEREDFIGAVAAGAVHFDAIDTDSSEAQVRFAGDAAIIVGRTTMRLRLPGADNAVTVRSRYTHVFRGDGATWRLVSAQGTEIR
jgi:pimeloyl-ACP methyl ester carboxylesterase